MSPTPERPADGQSTAHQLALDVIALAQVGGMPDTYWLTDSRVARACAVLNLTPERARDLDVTSAEES